MTTNQKTGVNYTEDKPMFKPKFNADELVEQFKKMTKPEAAKKSAKAGEKGPSTRVSNVSGFSGIRALHEYVFVTQVANMEPYQLQAYASKVMDIEYPFVKNETGKMKKFKNIRTGADGKPMFDANGNPVNRAYDRAHYTWYRNEILGQGKFNHAEEFGFSDEELQAAVDKYHEEDEDDSDDAEDAE